MLDTLTQLGGAPALLKDPVFGKYALSELLRHKGDGYAWAKGVHLYSELRPAEDLQIAQSDQAAEKYLRVIEEYTHAGIAAASLFGLELLELQGNVLHFHKDGENVEEAAIAALQFSHIFTKVLYETLAEDLGDDWRGFAICMDHGESVIVRRGKASNSSVVSVGPSANRPAKRLLYGKTPAGHAEIPGSWARGLLGTPCRSDWFAINLRDRDRLSILSSFENAELEGQLRVILNNYRVNRTRMANRSRPFVLVNASDLVDQGIFSTDRPLRMRAFCMRVDLDGFSAIVERAFAEGDDAVEAIAKGFIKILEFGDYFEKRHYGVVRLPWAGDCVAFLIPPTADLRSFRGKEWIAFVQEWQTFGANTPDGQEHHWAAIFSNVSWAVGITYADDGCCLVAPVSALSRKFLIGAGAPLAVAQDAEHLGNGGDTIIHSTDHKECFPIVRRLFSKVAGTEFWQTKQITLKKVRDAALEAGKSENASKIEIVEKAKTITLPPPMPYCE
jgi:hypothetical protein